MKIKELDPSKSVGGVIFKHPETGEACIWTSQWAYPEGKSGIWFKKPGDEQPDRVYPLTLDKLEEALEFEVVEV